MAIIQSGSARVPRAQASRAAQARPAPCGPAALRRRFWRPDFVEAMPHLAGIIHGSTALWIRWSVASAPSFVPDLQQPVEAVATDRRGRQDSLFAPRSRQPRPSLSGRPSRPDRETRPPRYGTPAPRPGEMVRPTAGVPGASPGSLVGYRRRPVRRAGTCAANAHAPAPPQHPTVHEFAWRSRRGRMDEARRRASASRRRSTALAPAAVYGPRRPWAHRAFACRSPPPPVHAAPIRSGAGRATSAGRRTTACGDGLRARWHDGRRR